MSIAFEKVSREELDNQPRHRGRFNEAVEAAIADPEQAVRLAGLSAEDAANLRQMSYPGRGRYGGKFHASARKQPDGTHVVFLTAVSA